MNALSAFIMKFGIVIPIILLCMGIAIQLGIMIPYFGLASIAANYNEYYTYTYSIIGAGDFGKALVSWDGVDESSTAWSFDSQSVDLADPDPYNWYDQCGNTQVDWVTDGSAETSTGWSAAFLYNALVYLVLLITTSLMLCCIVIPPVHVYVITATNCCALCLIPATLAGAILSIVRVNKSLGAACLEY